MARPIVQSLLAMPIAWLVASFAATAVWLTRTSPEAFDVRAVSGGVAEGALALLVTFGLSAAGHAALGWAGSAVHPAFSAHRPVVLGIFGAVCGAISFSVVAGAG